MEADHDRSDGGVSVNSHYSHDAGKGDKQFNFTINKKDPAFATKTKLQ